MSWDQDAYARSIIADIGSVKPLGDFVLVEPLSLDEQLRMEDRLMAPSPIQMTRDGRYVANRPRGLQYGRVVAVGAGDRAIGLCCEDCKRVQCRIERGQDTRKWRCSGCGSFGLRSVEGIRPELAMIARCEMGCGLGDIVIFPRVPANEISINGKPFVMIHEEQHVWGVVEQEEEAVAA